MTKTVGLRAKPYSYLKYDGSEDKKAKCAQKLCHKNKSKIRKL